MSASEEVAARLEAWDGALRPLVCRYDGAKLSETRAFRGGELRAGDSIWTSEVRVTPVADEPAALDLVVRFRLVEGEARSSGVAVAFDFARWTAENYVMIPAAAYDGNRCELVDRGYAQGLDRKFLYQPDIPEMSVSIPQLAPEAGSRSRLELTSCNAATPAMCFLDRRTGRAFILLAEQQTGGCDNGLVIEESLDRSRATFVVSAPGVRERRPLFVGFGESPDRGIDWKAGDEASLRLRVLSFETPGIPGLLKRFAAQRKAVTGSNRPRDLVPLSQTLEWMTRRIDERWHEGPEHRFYCPENAAWISFGWVGGLMNTFPMLALQDELHLERVKQTFDFAIPRAQGESGYLFGALNHDGKCFSREGYPELPELVLTRKNADVLFWMIKQFLLLEAQGRGDAIAPEWEAGVRHLADAFVATWKSQGQWGRLLNNHTGAVAEFGTSGGVMAIAGLALAARSFDREEYLEVARAAAEFYYERDVLGRGRTTGGCADILHNADAETTFGFLTALMALYEVTEESEWLGWCETLANLAATWTVSYDYTLPPETELARSGARLAGTVWASTQNKHGAPGICTSSGDPLFKLYRATGEPRHAELLRDIVHAHGESLRPGGYTNERLTFCDAEPHSVGNRGTHVTGWCELNGALMALEIPGIYVRVDTDRCYVFDHVKARVLERKDGAVRLELENPTPHDAEVSVLAESGDQAARPLGYTSFLRWPKYFVAAGATVELLVRPAPVRAGTKSLELEGATAEIYKTASEYDLYLYLFVPEGHDPAADARPAAVFFFGGGWNGGSPTQFEPHARYLASRGMVVAVADYRVKNRQQTTPRECVADGKSAVRYLRQHAARLGIDPERIAAGGGSAGGHVAACTGTLPELDDPADDLTVSSRSNALLLFNPVYDNGPEGGYGYDRVEDYWREISPAHHLDADTPPAIVFLGEEDDLIPVETARRFQARMKAAGVESVLHTYPEQGHGFFNERKGGTPIFLDTLRKLDTFLVELGYLEGTPSEAQLEAARRYSPR